MLSLCCICNLLGLEPLLRQQNGEFSERELLATHSTISVAEFPLPVGLQVLNKVLFVQTPENNATGTRLLGAVRLDIRHVTSGDEAVYECLVKPVGDAAVSATYKLQLFTGKLIRL